MNMYFGVWSGGEGGFELAWLGRIDGRRKEGGSAGWGSNQLGSPGDVCSCCLAALGYDGKLEGEKPKAKKRKSENENIFGGCF
jgi:hypothetical protein